MGCSFQPPGPAWLERAGLITRIIQFYLYGLSYYALNEANTALSRPSRSEHWGLARHIPISTRIWKLRLCLLHIFASFQRFPMCGKL